MTDSVSLSPSRHNNMTRSEFCSALVKECFVEERGLHPREWQIEVVSHILEMAFHGVSASKPGGPEPVLLVRSTGGGKSAARDVAGFLCGGIVVTIVPLLSLAADQTTKLQEVFLTLYPESDVNCRNAECINLDIIRGPERNEAIRRRLENLSSTDDDSIFLFVSPQKITSSKEWIETMEVLVTRQTLQFMAVDECHLFASQGMEFCHEFQHLSRAK
jgi:superfamily II DNA helicase RecQ